MIYVKLRGNVKFSQAHKKQFILHSILLGLLFGVLGYFLTEYRFLSPKDSSSQAGRIEIKAVGDKDHDSKSSEVWFYGAFRISDGSKIPWDELQLDPTWERRGDIYVSYKNQPSLATMISGEPIRLDFGSHPYSGIVNVKWENGGDTINLYSKTGSVKDIVVDQGPSYRNTRFYPLIIGCFVLLGVSLAAGFVFIRWKLTYDSIFLLFLLLSLYLTLSAYFPGVYTNDSVDQLHQALAGKYDDWHPPVMAWLWSVLIKGTGRIESFMMFHLLLLGMGAAYWFGIFKRLRVKFFGILLPALLVSPIVVNFSGVIWKDVGFAFSMFLCCGIVGLALVEKNISPGRIVAALILLAYAFGVRANGVFAIYPVAMFLSWAMLSSIMKKYSTITIIIISAVVSFLILITIILSVQMFSYQYIKSEKRYPFQYIEIYDLAGISTISGIDYFPDFIKKSNNYDIGKISESYAASVHVFGSANNLVFKDSNGSLPVIKLNYDPVLQKQLRDSWLRGIFEQPLSYLKHRWLVFDFLMSKGHYSSERPQSDGDRKALLMRFSNNSENVQISNFAFPGGKAAKEFISDTLAWSHNSFLYVGWFWMVLLLINFVAGLVIVRNTRSGLVILMLSASGLLYILPYFLVAPAADFRYLYWGSLAGGVSSILIASRTVSFVFKKFRNLNPNFYTSS